MLNLINHCSFIIHSRLNLLTMFVCNIKQNKPHILHINYFRFVCYLLITCQWSLGQQGQIGPLVSSNSTEGA